MARSGTVGPLFSIEEIEAPIEGSSFAARGIRERAALAAMARYTRGLTVGHPALGRRGAVCPFMATGIARGMVRFAACAIDPADADTDAAIAALRDLLQLFPPVARPDDLADPEMLRSLVIVFPALNDAAGARFVEGVQRRLKASFVAAGLMIGEFYPGCPTGGLHNPDFPALDAPETTIAIRRLTIHDAPFMMDGTDWVESYLGYFGEPGRKQVDRLLAARRAKTAGPAL